MFFQWSEDINEQIELAKHHGYLIGSFLNPEAVKQALGKDGAQISMSDESMEETLKLIRENTLKDLKAASDDNKNNQKRRRRRKSVS